MAGGITNCDSLLIRPIVSAHRLAGRCRFRRSGTIAHRFPSVRQSQAFTLIELLVVISIMTLLMAILLPTLQRVRSQARAVACQSNLRQWGVIFSMYANDNDGKMPDAAYSSGGRAYPGGRLVFNKIFSVDISIYENNLLLCPMATRWELRPDNTYPIMTTPRSKYEKIFGSKSTAWCDRYTDTNPFPPIVTEYYASGSYGINSHIGRSSIDIYPGSVRNNVPVFLDCIAKSGSPSPFDEPPEYEDHFNRGSGYITYFCINRHSGGINSLFLDWSVRKVGVKELWTLKWSDKFDMANVWTRAGGVQPESWPEWMRKFKDY